MENRVLMLIDSFGGGGVERTLTYLTRLRENGLKISVRSVLDTDPFHEFAPGTVFPPLLRNAKTTFQKGRFAAASLQLLTQALHWYRYPLSLRKRQLDKRTFHHLNDYYYACRALNQIISEEKPDVLMTFRRHSALIALMTKSVYRLTVPVYCSHRSYQTGRLHILPQPGLFQFAANRFYKKADFHTAVSNGVREDMIQNFNIPASQIATIYNGVDIELVRSRAREPVEQDEIAKILADPTVLKVGNMARLVESKGHLYLLQAFQQVRQKLDCRLFIAGDGDRREHLEALARELKIDGSVFFLGRRRNPFRFLARCDVFVSSSLTDGLPNAVLEAMACQLPVVAADCPYGPNEILAGGKHGILVPTKNETAMADAIYRVLTDQTLRKELRQQSGKRIQDFQVEIMLNKYKRLFEGDVESLRAIKEQT